MTCLWCGHPFRSRRGGSPQRFCSAAHRAAFHLAARRWAERAVSLGLITVADLKAVPAAYTLRPGGVSPESRGGAGAGRLAAASSAAVSKLSRDKGLRAERAIVAAHVGLGVPAERVPLSGAARYRGNGADIKKKARSFAGLAESEE